MNNFSALEQMELFGLYELTLDGTVLFFKARIGNEANEATAKQNLVGRNLFTENCKFENIEDFRRRFENFVIARQTIDSFTFSSSRSESQKLLRVLPVRLGGRGSRDERNNFILADLRRA